jgi:hypothetical protein
VGGLLLSALAATGIALLLRPGASLGSVRTLTALYGVGLGFANTPLLIALQTSVPWNRRGVATASTMFFRTIGGTIAVGVLGGILAASVAGAGPRQVVEQLLGPERAALDPALVASVAGALQRAMGSVFWASAAIAAAGFAAALAFPHVPIAPRREQAPASPSAAAGEGRGPGR